MRCPTLFLRMDRLDATRPDRQRAEMHAVEAIPEYEPIVTVAPSR